MALLNKQAWSDQHELTFRLWLERAECELLSGDFEKAEQLIGELLQRGASDVEFADASCLKINLHVMTGEHPLAIDSALGCLRRFGIDLPAHPTIEQVRAEHEAVWQALNGRLIESLIDLPLMTDPKMQAAMQVLSVLAGPATFTDFQLFCLLACRMVNVSIQHGMGGASAYAYACLGSVLGANFHRYSEGYRLARLACDLVEKHAFAAYGTKVYHAMGLAAFWTQPLTSVIELRRAATRAATERGDLTFACYGMHQSITYLLTRNDPLDAVWRVGDGAGLRSHSQVPRCRGPHREPATLHRQHAGSRCDLLYLQRRAIRRGGVRSATDGRTDADRDLFTLDSQTQGAVFVRRLRRSSPGIRQREGASSDLHGTVADARLLLLHCADSGGAL